VAQFQNPVIFPTSTLVIIHLFSRVFGNVRTSCGCSVGILNALLNRADFEINNYINAMVEQIQKKKH